MLIYQIVISFDTPPAFGCLYCSKPITQLKWYPQIPIRGK